MVLHRPPKKKVHRFPEKGPRNSQAQRIRQWTKVMGISSEANERTSGTKLVLSTWNGSHSTASLESGKFILNMGRSQRLNWGKTPGHLRMRRRRKRRWTKRRLVKQSAWIQDITESPRIPKINLTGVPERDSSVYECNNHGRKRRSFPWVEERPQALYHISLSAGQQCDWKNTQV